MHYRNGREAKNGDKIVTLGLDSRGGLVDALHVDDLAAILAEKGLDKRPAGK
jgi:hypothetical protein